LEASHSSSSSSSSPPSSSSVTLTNPRPSMEGLKQRTIELEACGTVAVFIQGENEKLKDGVVFLTIHDVGATYQTWLDFSGHPSMEEIRKRAVFLHVALPGQEPEADDLTKPFPTMTQLGLGLVTVLDQLRVTTVVGLGDGAGANIITRFAMNHPGRVHGIINVNPACVKNNPSIMAKIKDQISQLGQDSDKGLNEKNVAKFAEVYKKRTEILTELKQRLKCDILLVAGAKSKSVLDTEALHREMAPGICSIIKVEKVSEPLLESPDKTAEALLLFCQGLGLLPNVGRRASRQDSLGEGGEGRRVSMSDYDTPNIRRLSLSAEAVPPEKDEEEMINPSTMACYDKPNIRRLSLTAT